MQNSTASCCYFLQTKATSKRRKRNDDAEAYTICVLSKSSQSKDWTDK